MQALGLSSIFIGIAGALEKMLVIQASGVSVQGTMLAVLSLAAGALSVSYTHLSVWSTTG